MQTRALRTYDFTKKDNEIELIIQFREGGLKGELIYASALDDIFFNDEKLEQLNMPKSLKAPFSALAHRTRFPSNLKDGTLKFVESGLSYKFQSKDEYCSSNQQSKSKYFIKRSIQKLQLNPLQQNGRTAISV